MHFVAHSRFTAAAGAACLVVFASVAASAAPRRPPPSAPPAAAANAAALQQNIDVASLDHALLAAAIFHETNRVRADFRLTPFAWLPEIDRAADLQANSTALSVTSGHGHLLPSLATPSDRAEYVGLRPRLLGENSALLPILQFDPAGYIVREEQGRNVWRHATSEQVVPPHSYRSFAAKIV
ncbi:MAG TPA: hypothetical protein VEQ65_13070, partial [Opitutus sp.]|nr:hypothetical protein [Opitutus sp.]